MLKVETVETVKGWLVKTAGLLTNATPVTVEYTSAGPLDVFVLKSNEPQLLVGKHGVTLNALHTVAQRIAHEGRVRVEVERS